MSPGGTHRSSNISNISTNISNISHAGPVTA